jgi:hypothetical protein
MTPANRASTAPLAPDLPRGAVTRALDLIRSHNPITPYQREVYRARLRQILNSSVEVQAVEDGLATEFGDSFYEYAWHGARLRVLLARNTPVARFALILAHDLEAQAIDLTTLALGSETELFPELFANNLLNEEQQRFLAGQLDNEYERELAQYIQTVLRSVPTDSIPTETPVVEREVCWQQGERYCYDLVPLLERLAAGNEFNPHNGRPLTPLTLTALRRRYAPQLLMVRYYLQLRGTPTAAIDGGGSAPVLPRSTSRR